VKERLLGRDYSSSSAYKRIQDMIATKLADDYYEENRFELIKGLDMEACIKLAQVKLAAKIAKEAD
jgi:hypothetical protein